MSEIWKDIPGYEGRYQASTYGRIRSIDRKVKVKRIDAPDPFHRELTGRILKPVQYDSTGHVAVNLSGGGRRKNPVHQLVLKTFVGPAPKGHIIRHLNGEALDNRLENLAYGTHRENILDDFRNGTRKRKLSLDNVLYIRKAMEKGLHTVEDLAKRYEVSVQHINRIHRREVWGWVE